MPTYDYQCDACGHKFEQLQSISSGPLKKCPQCGKLKLKRLLGTGVGVIFKGSGFYQTDYRSDSYKKAADSDKPAAAAATTTETKTPEKKETKPAVTETKTESKTESKPESKPAPKKKSS
jgi:putative FmdB family regulatory protein